MAATPGKATRRERPDSFGALPPCREDGEADSVDVERACDDRLAVVQHGPDRNRLREGAPDREADELGAAHGHRNQHHDQYDVLHNQQVPPPR